MLEYYSLSDEGIERRVVSDPVQKVESQKEVGGQSSFFEKLDTGLRSEDRMDLSERREREAVGSFA